MTLPEKPCVRCGRRITWRKKWERDWESVRYCSARCRGAGAPDDGLEEAILAALASRARGATCCPSEIARARWPADWREHMEEVREAARRLAGRGMLHVVQGGRTVDPSRARGPIRLRLAR